MKEIMTNRKHKHLNEIERGQISILKAQGMSAYRIAKIMGRAENTIRNELRRGNAKIALKEYSEQTLYFPEKGQAIYERNRKRVCSKLKIEKLKYREFIDYVEERFFTTKHSIEAIYHTALKNKLFKKENMVCINSLYSYIDKGYMKIKNIDLPCKVSRKPVKHMPPRKHKRLYGNSIEKRQKYINSRKQFGHWEIDTVIGKNTKNQSSLLVLTERKSRMEIIRKLSGKTSSAVMKEMHNLITEYGNDFNKIFLSITSDNGTEFSQLHTLENITGTKVYYAHPYSAFERGSNERNNRIIRYFIKKGTSINNISDEKIKNIEKWINTLPRKILNFNTAYDIFNKELKRKKAAFKTAIS